MYIPKTSYIRKETSHGKDTVKEVIIDKTHLPGLLQFAKSNFFQGQTLEPHFHESMSEVFYVVKGSVKVTYNGQTFVSKSGDSFFVKARKKHSFIFLEDTEFIYFCLEDYQ